MIKRYDTTLYIDGKYIPYISEHPKGDYVKASELREQLTELLDCKTNESCDIMSFLYELQEELK